jgi:hypothetical protein
MNATRKAITRKVFKKLDKSGVGSTTMDQIKDLYDPSKHPDVLSRKKTEDDVLTEFLDTFELYYALTVIFNLKFRTLDQEKVR